ncbi:helix-turn-helix domain-containing protein [Solwaraspora sp. WMMB762]|uniref:helix-turn-helix domain-containing protein n=1 Tax=Solwaraspora sp. WMMB762 TaxID=3404120 RepID=UPI003B924948
MSASEYLIEDLRRVREMLGLTQEAWGERLHFSASHVGAVERGERPALPDYLGAVDRAHGTAFMKFYREFIRGEWTPVWYRPFVEYEGRAKLLRIFQPMVMPGLLQTEAYARALLQALNTKPEELEPTLAARLDRQEIVTRATNACRLVVVLDEIVLRRSVGGPEVMRDQLKAIADANQRQNVQVHIVPFTTGGYPGVLGPMVLATVDGRTVGFLEGHLEGRLIEATDATEALEEDWETIRGYALPGQQSHEMIMEAIETWS